MDPFSIIAGTAGLADVCVRCAKFLKNVKDGFEGIDEDLDDLCKEIDGIQAVNDLVVRSYEAGSATTTDPNDSRIFENHWRATRTTLAGCQNILEQLDSLLVGILSTGNGKHAKRDKLRKYLKQQSKEGELGDLRQKLGTYQVALQTSLTAVTLIYTCKSQRISTQSFSELSRSIEHLGGDLQSKIVSLQKRIDLSAETTLVETLQSAREIVPFASINKHFYIPQSVSSIFAGRHSDLNNLKQCLEASSTKPNQVQNRFVIYGHPGSGKTQFCCKFASDNKERFWGVFWIDAGSKENAAQSFSLIARVGKVAPNERAAKNWLSTLGSEQPWLLIIDNADDQYLPVEEYFPDGNSGTILITTRDPMLRVHGTVGPCYYHFNELEAKDSIELLLKAASEPEPWSQSTIDSAQKICRTLGYSPLVLVHAGKAILAHLCTLDTYIGFFEKNWSRIRQMKKLKNGTPISDENAAIYSSYELIHESLVNKKTQASEDALELLNIFSFLHRQRIQVDIFLRAATNPKLERLDQQQRSNMEKGLKPQRRPSLGWENSIKSMCISAVSFLVQLGTRPILPRILRDDSESGPFDEVRLRQALKELFQKSLIFESDQDSYSMHPAVHLWVRERPEMTLGDQAVWCKITATILSQAILLPPLGDREEDEILRRDLLPHVSQVQRTEQAIQAIFLRNQERRRNPWPVLPARFDRQQALELVKFSLVFTQGDELKEAERLQRMVVDFALRTLGIEHTSTMDVMLLLSSTYWRLTKGDEAADLQKRVLEACIRVRGQEDLKTLRVMDAYGSSRSLQGRVREARQISTTAVGGLRKLLGEDHIDTLRAMGNLGRAVGKDFEFTKAIEIHSKVYSGLRTQLGHSHLDTIIAMDGLAMAHYDRAAFGYGHPQDLEKANDMESEVFSMRKEKLGKEHLYTLWAGLNLARIKCAQGKVEEALSIFLSGHSIAVRNLGETHFAVLFGKTHWARILMRAGRYAEAREILTDVINTYEGRRQRHPDRLLAIFSLIRCLNLLGRTDETWVLLEELTECTTILFGPDHPSVKYLLDPLNLSKEPGDGPNRPTEPTDEGVTRQQSW